MGDVKILQYLRLDFAGRFLAQGEQVEQLPGGAQR